MAPGGGIPLDPAALFDKLVTRHRGRYRFEHNVLFRYAFEARGFASITDRRYSRAGAADQVTVEIANARDYRMRLSLAFGIDLAANEVDAFGLFAPIAPAAA